MYGEFEKDVINELRQANRTLQEILCYQAIILHRLDRQTINSEEQKGESDGRT